MTDAYKLTLPEISHYKTLFSVAYTFAKLKLFWLKLSMLAFCFRLMLKKLVLAKRCSHL